MLEGLKRGFILFVVESGTVRSWLKLETLAETFSSLENNGDAL